MKKIYFKDEEGNEIKKITAMVSYMDGWVVLTEDGDLYTDVISLQNRHVDNSIDK